MRLENMIIRTASLDDIDDIMKIERECFPIGIVENEDVFIERIKTFKDGFLVVVDKELNQCVGYITSEIWKYNKEINDENFNLGHSIQEKHHEDGEELYIASTGVLNEYCRKGLGSLLFTELLMVIKTKYFHVKSAILIVSSTWIPAQKIYKRNGFVEKKIISQFFQPVDQETSDGIIMRKSL